MPTPLATQSTDNPATRPDAGDLLYVIYTSGSTGRPKGAGVRHGGFANLLNWYRRTLDLGPADRGLLVSALGFDLTQKNLFAPLVCGAALYFPDMAEGYDPAVLRAAIAEHGITWINCTPSAFYPLVEGGRRADPADLASLRHVVLGGEPIRRDRLIRWLDHPSCRALVLNSYGPTECTDVAVAGPLDPQGNASDVPLGRPIDNVRLRVVDASDTPQPVGVPGELLIGGAGVGTGYLGRDDLTARQFVDLPVDGRPQRFYRTGDMVAWRADGSLDYLGRRDAQVKLRGFRIELDEIEAVLRAQPGVADAAVVVRRAGSGDHLAAYLVCDGNADPEDLRPALLRTLPGYMVPDSLVRLERLPLSPNGKLDRRTLESMPVASRPGEGPVGATETRIAGIWSRLLDHDAVDRHASFFSIGGHSLLAVQLVARIADAFDVDISLRELFETPTVAGLAARLDTRRTPGYRRLTALPPQETAEPSFAQQRLMFLDQLEGPSAAYSMPAVLDLAGALDAAALRAAVTALVARHESLRLCFRFEDGRPVARRLAPYDPLTERDLSALPETEAVSEAERLAEEAAARPFDLAFGPLFRLHLLRIGPERHRLLVNLHHIIADGWSIDLLIHDLARLYAADRRGEAADLPPLDLQYTDFAAWQRHRLDGDGLEEHLAFWRDCLADAPTLTELPTDHPRGAVQIHRGGAVSLSIERNLAEGLRAVARAQDATLFMLLTAAFKLVLFRFSGVRDLSLGVPVANRGDSRLERVVGLFLNTVVVRSRVPADGSFAEFVAAERSAALAAFAHQDLPFEALVDALHPTRSLGHNPLFQVMINLVNTRRADPALEGIQVTRLTPEQDGMVKFDLNLTLTEQADGSLDGALQYNAALFEAETMAFLADGLHALLRRVVSRPDAPLSELSVLPETLPPPRPMPAPAGRPVRFGSIERSIPARFAEQAARHRNRIAIRTPEGSMTYGGLDRAARCLAAELVVRDAPPRVALLVPHDARMAVAMLGCLQAGRCYVPLDPGQPVARLRAILEDVATDLVVAAAPHLDLARDLVRNAAVLDLDTLDRAPAENLPQVAPDEPAYILYTSGSTGRPKGVVQTHRNVLHFIRRYAESLRLRPQDRLLQVASYAFDAAVMDLYGALLTGACLYPVDLRRTSLAEAAAWMAREEIGVLHATPSVFRALTAELNRSSPELRLPAVRLVVLGGEAATRADFDAFRARFEPGCLFVNGLGPTESTVTLQLFADHDSQFTRASLPVGYPVKGTHIALLDETGAPGELFGEIAITSPHVTPGYWRQESDVFAAEPHRPGMLRYRSGDLARRLPDGSLEVVGRRDAQIKLRGFRIEPGEIEAVLRGHPGIDQAAVLRHAPRALPDAARLVAYLSGTATPDEALAWCRSRLPDYMVPAQAISLPVLPLTITGKLDRTALPEPSEPASSGDDDRPATPGEELLAGLWAEVLGIEAVGRHRNFFDLGGHSLLATQLVSRIRRTFAVDVPLRLLFEHPVLADQAAALDQARRDGDTAPPPPITPRTDRDILPLSYAQQRLWFLAQLDGESSAASYNVTAALALAGALDQAALRRALLALTGRHESLRMAFYEEAGQPAIRLRPPFDPLVVEDLSGLDPADREAEVEARAIAHAAAPFDLERDPLLRLALLRLDENRHVLLVNLHHIAADGWSLGVLVRDLGALYAEALGAGPGLAPPALQYADYAAWQRDRLRGAVLERQRAYWRDRLDGAPGLLELPADRPRPAVKTGRGAQLAVSVEPELLARLEALGRARGATLFMTLMAAFNTLLHRYTGESDLLVGSPIANRTQRQTEDLVGFFVNTLVLRCAVRREEPFAELLARMRDTALQAYAHQDLPFESLVTELQPERSLSHSPLFQVMFGLQNAPSAALTLGDLAVTALSPEHRSAKFDLTVSAVAGPAGLHLSWEYSTDLFDRARIERMAGHYTRLLQAVVETPDAAIGRLPMLQPGEPDRIAGWSGGASPYPREAGLAELFAEQVARTPGAVALRHGAVAMTYGELAARSDRLAAYLTEQAGDLAGRVVGLCLERGPALVTAMLAVLKAGAAYLPLDPALPAERRRYMMDDAGAALAIGESAFSDGLDDLPCPVVLLDHAAEAIAACTAPVPTPELHGGSLAYVMYTSGSTGRPKGVRIPQRAVTRLVRDTDYVAVTPATRIAQAANTAFDAATFEIWGALLNGACTVLLDRDDVLDPDRFAGLLRAGTFDTLFLTTALFNRLAQIDPALFDGLDTLLFGGEAVDPRWVRAVLDAGGPRRLLHVYGPTECTTFATWHMVTEVPDDAVTVPIGRPIANTTAQILDPDGQPVPVGVAGELHLGGDGLAEGYLGQPDLTAERFITHPTLGRLYRTGDLCRWGEDGTIAHLGRTDHQIKLRGFRIEPAEIEGALRRCQGVEDAVVRVAGEAEHRRLAAYVAGHGLDVEAIRTALRRDLPDYMIPAHITALPALPLNANGKLDRTALPEPSEPASSGGDDRPATPGEELLAGLWGEVLGLEAVGRHRNFFDLGGHSLLATQLVSRIRRTFAVDVPLRLLFEHPVLADQAAALDHARRDADTPPPPPITPRADRDARPLSFAQQRLWFLAQLDGASAAASYNVTAALALAGALDQAALRRALLALTGRHESLRMALYEEAGQPAIRLRPPFDPLVVEDLSGLDPADREAEVEARAIAHAAAPFDLERDPLLRLALLRLDENRHVLLVNLHHIAADGWSLGVLVRDLGALYAEALGTGPGLAPPALQYADYAAWQRDRLRGAVLERQRAYWRDRLDGAPGLLELPADRPRPAVKTGRGAQLAVSVEPELLARLEALGRARGATLFMTLMAAFNTLLHRYTGESDLLVGSPIANRTQRQTEDLVGFFVNTLVLRCAVRREEPFAELLARMRDTALQAYAHQDLPFESLVTELQPERSLSHSPLFQVMFGLQNAPSAALTLGDLAVTALSPEHRSAKFDLTVSAVAGPAGLHLSWEYSTDLFDRARIERMAGHYTRLLQAVVETPDAAIGRLPMLEPGELDRIAGWTGGAGPYPREAGLAELFAEQVAKAPGAVALRHGDASVTYGELAARSDRLAAYLTQQAGEIAGRVVGLCLERGPALVTAMLAVLKAGAAYLPLDPALPAERRRYMMQDAGAALVIGEEPFSDGLDDLPCPVVLLDRDADAVAACTAPVPTPALHGGSLAYVMYTSGSTGRPKGVRIPQRAVTRLVRDTDYVALTPATRIAQAANTAFDAATFEIWGALLNGARTVLLDRDDVLDPDRFAGLLRAGSFDTLFLTTALFNRLAQIDPALFGGLDTLLFGGEAVDPRWVRAVLDAGGPHRLLQCLRPHRVHHLRHLAPGHRGARRCRDGADRQADRQHHRPDPRPGRPAGAGRRGRRAASGRRRPGRGLSGPARPDGRAVHRPPHPGAALPHRRPVPLGRGRHHRLSRPDRRPDQAARLPHRARGDRGSPAPLPGRGGRRRARHRRGRAPAPRRLCRRPRTGRRDDPHRPAPRPARLHGAGAYRRPAGPAAQRERQARPQRPAGTGGIGAIGVRTAAHPARDSAGGDLASGARARAGRARRQFLRAGRRFDPQHPDRRPGPGRRAEDRRARPVRAPEHRRPRAPCGRDRPSRRRCLGRRGPAGTGRAVADPGLVLRLGPGRTRSFQPGLPAAAPPAA